MQPFSVKIFSGNFLQETDFEHCNPIENYTLSNLARQVCNNDVGLYPPLCGWVGVPCITDMSPKPNTDLHLFYLLSSEVHQC